MADVETEKKKSTWFLKSSLMFTRKESRQIMWELQWFSLRDRRYWMVHHSRKSPPASDVQPAHQTLEFSLWKQTSYLLSCLFFPFSSLTHTHTHTHTCRHKMPQMTPAWREGGWKVYNPNTNEKQIPTESHLKEIPAKTASFKSDCKSPFGISPSHCFQAYLCMFLLSQIPLQCQYEQTLPLWQQIYGHLKLKVSKKQ